MANLYLINNIPNRVAEICIKLKNITSKMHNTSTSIAFIKKALFVEVVPRFAKVKGQFINEKDRLLSSQSIMKSHLTKHIQHLYNLSKTYNNLTSLLYNNIGVIFGKTLINIIRKSLSKRRYLSFKTKNKKIINLIKSKPTPCNTTYSVPIINLSSYSLSNQEKQQLKVGLDYSFVDKHNNVKKFLAANMETLADRAKNKVDHSELENFHEFLRGYTDIFTNNIYATKDYTYHNLREMIQNKDVVVVKGDKDSSVVIMNKLDYLSKLQAMIDDGIKNGTYVETTDNTLQDLSRFQDFLYRNFYKKYSRYDDMYPSSNQPARLYGTAKTHKFENLKDISVEKLKFRPIIDQTGTFTYNTAKVISDYLRPLCKNEYSINDTQKFPEMLSSIPPLQDDEEDVSYDVESLFTNIPIQETIDYIIKEIYINKKLEPICSKLIFSRLLMKLATECTFKINNKFYKQVDGCTMGGPLSVTFSDIYMAKLENEVVVPIKPIFYKRYVDDIYSRRKKGDDYLFNQMNSYHPNIKLTIELSPSKFLDTKLTNISGIYKFNVHRKQTKLPIPWTSKVPKRYKCNTINGDK